MHCRDVAISVNWVDSDAGLRRAVASWQGCIGLDTEFMRHNTFYPVPGLYQIASGNDVYLLDPMGIDDWAPFAAFLADPDQLKIMHACLEDLELIYHHLQVVTRNVFDTQYAQAFVSEDFSLSYSSLVAARLQAPLPKHETRSNWLQRPLTEEQLDYAVADVTYLSELCHAIQADLDVSGKAGWFRADMDQREIYEPADPLAYYRNLKKAWHLSGAQLVVLQRLCAWREFTARDEDVPRNRVVWDDHLYEFAKVPNLTLDAVHAALPQVVARRYGDSLVDAHRDGGDSTLLEPLDRPLTSRQGAQVKQLKSVGLEVARARELAPELICRKRDLESCVRHHAATGELSPVYSNWRKDLVGGQFLQVLNGG